MGLHFILSLLNLNVSSSKINDSFWFDSSLISATDARRALPCWDEPACKATFDVKLNVPGGKTALSNMNQTNEEKLRVVLY